MTEKSPTSAGDVLELEEDFEHDNPAENSDSSDEEMKNRIGENIPLEWYDEYDHIGYDVRGQPVAKLSPDDSITDLLARRDDKNAWRWIDDPINGTKHYITDEELSVINKLRHNKPATSGWEPGPEYYNTEKQVTIYGPLYEPKHRFIPSRWEAKAVYKLMHSMRNGWMKLPSEEAREKKKKEEEEDDEPIYLLWGDDGKAPPTKGAGTVAIPAPKIAPPTDAESYNPPPEYLPTEEELNAWKLLDPEDRPYNYTPQKFNAFRDVPLYRNFIKERFERCLDLYLCPRAQKKKLKDVDPESLIPKLPKPQDLRPFPTSLAIEFIGHKEKIRSISLSPNGQWLASGSDDRTVRLWEISTGRCFKQWIFSELINALAWNPATTGAGLKNILAIAVGKRIVLLNTQTGSRAEMDSCEGVLAAEVEQNPILVPEKKMKKGKEEKESKILYPWKRSLDTNEEKESSDPQHDGEEALSVSEIKAEDPAEVEERKLQVSEWKEGWSRLTIHVGKVTQALHWHQQGDYLASVSADKTASSVLIHRLTKQHSQAPLSKAKGLIQRAVFHPTKAFLMIATQRVLRIYNLVKQNLMKKLTSPARWISSLSIHPNGDHVLLGSYDCKVCWYDLDQGTSPFKTLKYHTKAVRAVQYHSSYPLFATSSDDGTVHIFHSTVYTDLTTPPLIVPVKILHAHTPLQNLGVLDVVWHPQQPWIFTAGADQVIRLFT